ncbi:MAG: hypothetical protein ACOX5Q_03930 [Bacillota bacterium]
MELLVVMGAWSTHAFTGPDGKKTLSGSAPPSKAGDEVAKVATDELIVIGTSGETADKFQFRVILHGPDGEAGTEETNPKVLLMPATIRNTLEGQTIAAAYDEEGPEPNQARQGFGRARVFPDGPRPEDRELHLQPDQCRHGLGISRR